MVTTTLPPAPTRASSSHTASGTPITARLSVHLSAGTSGSTLMNTCTTLYANRWFVIQFGWK